MDSDEPRAEAPDDRRARAEAALRAIAGGADPSAEAFRLANGFTDEATGRFTAAVRRMLRRPPRG